MNAIQINREVRPFGPDDTVYREFHINHDGFAWVYTHDDYDGAPDANDNRCGHARTLQAAKDEIDEWWIDQAEQAQPKIASYDFSVDYQFEDIEIEEDGIFFGSFSGIAELALNDPRDGDFYVKHIAIDGQKRERQTLKGYSLSVMKRTDAVLMLPWPAADCQTFKARLFRKIEAALYASSHAREQFAGEMEAA